MAVQTQNLDLLNSDVQKQKTNHLKTTALRAYSTQQNSSIDERKIVELLPLVPRIARRAVSYIKPPLTFEDLVAAGTVGLVKAAKDYDLSRNANFKTYAYIRIRGAVLDELKKWSFIPQQMSKQIKEATQTAKDFRERNGIDPTDEQLAAELNISIDRLYEIFKGARIRYFLSIDQNQDETQLPVLQTRPDNTYCPESNALKMERAEKVKQAISQLPEKKRKVIVLYYQNNLNMKQIAELLSITESRVSQLHAAAIFNLSLKLKE